MHILIALLTAIATLLFALDRLGIDIGWVNPWAWGRRRRWLKQLHTNPAFNLDSPMEAVALLLVATARIEGDLSSDEKNELRAIFEETFKQSEKDISALLISSTYLLGSGEEVVRRPDEVLSRSLNKFSDEQKASAIEVLKRISNVGGPASESQKQFVSEIDSILHNQTEKESW
ncbi:MAG: TerB family tellurite resistance protein [Pseudomonadales bacterium]|nr:TerB family tellurite resistance protein [Pseudomonadales bacterium]